MADHPYSNFGGPQWQNPAAERPAAVDRTEPMSRQERDAHATNPSFGGPQQHQQPSRLSSHEHTGGIYTTQSVNEAPPAQWPSETTAPPPAMSGPGSADPELAAFSGMDRTEPPRQYGQSTPPPAAHSVASSYPPPPHQPPHHQPPQHQAPQHFPPPSAPPQHGPPQHQSPLAAELDEPTQMHNPVASAPPAQHHQHQSQPPERAHSYPSQVAEGVYQSEKSGSSPLTWVVAAVMMAPIGYVMVRALAAGADVNASTVVAATFALVGVPVAAHGLQASLAANPLAEGNSPLRPPYIWLATGLVLLIAAGLAA